MSRFRMPMQAFCVVLCSAITVAIPVAHSGEVPKTLSFLHHTNESDFDGVPVLPGYFGFAVWGKHRPNKPHYAELCVKAAPNEDLKQTSPNIARDSDYATSFRVKQDEIVAFFGTCYRVKNTHTNPVELEALDGRTLPAGLTTRTNVFLLPYQGSVSMAGRLGVIYVADISSCPKTMAYCARIEFSPTFEYNKLDDDGRPNVISTDFKVVKVGDAIPLADWTQPREAKKVRYHRVVTIVPPDAEKKVIGWVEVEHEPFNL